MKYTVILQRVTDTGVVMDVRDVVAHVDTHDVDGAVIQARLDHDLNPDNSHVVAVMVGHIESVWDVAAEPAPKSKKNKPSRNLYTISVSIYVEINSDSVSSDMIEESIEAAIEDGLADDCDLTDTADMVVRAIRANVEGCQAVR